MPREDRLYCILVWLGGRSVLTKDELFLSLNKRNFLMTSLGA